MYRDIDFSVICVGLFGDPGQLPCVKGCPLWCVPMGSTNLPKYISELFGKTLFDSVLDVVHLNCNLHLDLNDVDSNAFNNSI